METDIFLYHCFPRRRSDTEDINEKKGLGILNLIVQNGFLLTPEQLDINLWPHSPKNTIPIFQKGI